MNSRFPPDLSPDDPNPYAPPKTRESFGRPVGLGVVPFDLGCIMSAAWALYKERFGACLAVCWTVMVLIWGSQYLQPRLAGKMAPRAGAPFESFVLQFSLFFLVYVFNGWVSIGQNLALLEIARRRPGAFDQVFRGGRFLLTSLLAGVLFMAALGGAALLSFLVVPIAVAIGGRGGPAVFIAFALGIAIAGGLVSYLSLRLSQFHYMIVDQDAGVLDSLSLSWEATHGRAGTLMVVYLFVILIFLAGLLACLVGIFFTAPFAYLMLAVTYLSLTEQPLADAKPEIEYWDDDEP